MRGKEAWRLNSACDFPLFHKLQNYKPNHVERSNIAQPLTFFLNFPQTKAEEGKTYGIHHERATSTSRISHM